MMLSRLELDPRHRDVMAAVRDPARLHTLVIKGFPLVTGASPRASLGVLHRLDQDGRGRVALFVQSRESPNWSPVASLLRADIGPEAEVVRSIAADVQALGEGQLLAFRLRANAARKIETKTGADGKKRNGKRVPLRDPAARVAWLMRKGEAAGFALVEGLAGEPELRITDEGPLHAGRGHGDSGMRLTVEAVRFDGVIRVTDATKLRAAIEAGIGPARAYGCGLVSYRPLG